jgi:hypothetical protein
MSTSPYLPPMSVSLRVTDQGHTRFRLWLPLFLLWLLLLPLLVLVLVVTLLADLFTLLSGDRPGYTRFVFGLLGMVGATRGTEFRVNDKKNTCQSVAFTLR